MWYGEVEQIQKRSVEPAFERGDLQLRIVKERGKVRNRDILSHLIATTLYLAREGTTFRWDDETSSSQNQWNFQEFLELFSKYDSVIKLHLDAIKEKQGNQKWTQKDLIKALDISVRCVIQTEIQESKICSVLMDEATDRPGFIPIWTS